MMKEQHGALIDEAQEKAIADYFVAKLPRTGAAEKPVIIAGPAKVRFKMWGTPTPGSRPHDPLSHAPTA